MSFQPHGMDAIATRYIVVGMLRSGTTATHYCLRGHPSVSALQPEVGVEPLFEKGMTAFTFGKRGTDVEEERGVSALFDAITSIQQTEERRARGIKCAIATSALAQTFVEGMRAHLPDTKIIHVERRDAVARYASLQKSKQTERWRRSTDGTGPKRIRMTLDAHDFAEYVIDSYRIRTRLDALRTSHDVLTVSYEDVILEGNLPIHSPLFEFVGVEPKKATWLKDRKLSPPAREYVENYEELKQLCAELRERLENGAVPEVLRKSYGAPFWKTLGRRALFWLRRPGYAAYRMENALEK